MKNLPLHEAVKQNDIDKISSILSSSIVDINAEDENGVTALIEACISGNEKIVQMLLDAGCPAQPSSSGKGFRHTPLRGATVCGNAHLIPILLENGADPNALSDGNRTPLMGACFLRKEVEGNVELKSLECVTALLKDERTDQTIANSFGETALDLAKVRGYKQSIELLEKALLDWNEKKK